VLLNQFQEGSYTVVQPKESRLDAAVAVDFKDQLKEIADQDCDCVILDMSQVAFMDSSGLGSIIGVIKHMGDKKRLELASLTPSVDKVFTLTRMNDVLTVHTTIEDALRV
jgi:anti-sigma B factor antagonist